MLFETNISDKTTKEKLEFHHSLITFFTYVYMVWQVFMISKSLYMALPPSTNLILEFIIPIVLNLPLLFVVAIVGFTGLAQIHHNPHLYLGKIDFSVKSNKTKRTLNGQIKTFYASAMIIISLLYPIAIAILFLNICQSNPFTYTINFILAINLTLVQIYAIYSMVWWEIDSIRQQNLLIDDKINVEVSKMI